MTVEKQLSKIDSRLLADYILEQHGPMSHLKLQKLLYLVEGYHLAYFGEELVEDNFEAWAHGPVSRRIYDSLKDKSRIYADLCYESSESQETPSSSITRLLTVDQLELVNETLGMYCGESGFALESLTHAQAPWINARGGLPLGERCNSIISKDDMRQYFAQFVN